MRRVTLWAGITASLKELRAFSAMIPANLGGGGLPHSEMCRFIREMSHNCSSTPFGVLHALVAAAVLNYRRGNPGEKRRRLSLFRVEAVRQWLARR